MSAASRERMLMLAAARLCAAAAPLGVASLALALLALAVLAFAEPSPRSAWALWAMALTGVAAGGYAVRLRFDAALFADLAGGDASAETVGERAAALDAALATLRARESPARAARTLADRALGARRLVLRLGAVTLVQSGIALIAMLPS